MQRKIWILLGLRIFVYSLWTAISMPIQNLRYWGHESNFIMKPWHNTKIQICGRSLLSPTLTLDFRKLIVFSCVLSTFYLTSLFFSQIELFYHVNFTSISSVIFDNTIFFGQTKKSNSIFWSVDLLRCTPWMLHLVLDVVSFLFFFNGVLEPMLHWSRSTFVSLIALFLLILPFSSLIEQIIFVFVGQCF